MAKATSISAANLAKFTQAAVRGATAGQLGKIITKGPTMGFVVEQGLSASDQLALADRIANGVAANAKVAGVVGLKPQPVVVVRPGKIIVGFLAPELGITIR